jgi:hypothetical protein
MDLEINWTSILLVAFASHILWDVLKWGWQKVLYPSGTSETNSYGEKDSTSDEMEVLSSSSEDEDSDWDSITSQVNQVRHRRKKNKTRSSGNKSPQKGLGQFWEKIQNLTQDKAFVDRIIEKSKELTDHSEFLDSEFLEKESVDMVVDMVQKICNGETPDLDRLESLNEKLTENFSHFLHSFSSVPEDKDLEQKETRDSEIVRQRLEAVLES